MTTETTCPKCGAICFDGPQHFNCKANPLNAAIAALGAVEVAPDKFALQANRAGVWALLSGADILRKVEANRRGLACTGLAFTFMPAWWTPERRYIIRCPHGRADYQSCVDADCGMGSDGDKWETITADLTTGEEVPA